MFVDFDPAVDTDMDSHHCPQNMAQMDSALSVRGNTKSNQRQSHLLHPLTSLPRLLCADYNGLHDSCERKVLNAVAVFITDSGSKQTTEIPIAPKHKSPEEREPKREGETLDNPLSCSAIKVTRLE